MEGLAIGDLNLDTLIHSTNHLEVISFVADSASPIGFHGMTVGWLLVCCHSDAFLVVLHALSGGVVFEEISRLAFGTYILI